MCCLHDRAITDRQKQQIRERRVNSPAPCGVEQVRANVHFDPCPLLEHDSLLEGCFAKREGHRSLRARINLRKFQLVAFHFLSEAVLHIR